MKSRDPAPQREQEVQVLAWDWGGWDQRDTLTAAPPAGASPGITAGGIGTSKEMCECRGTRPRCQGTLLPMQAAQQGLLQLHGMSPLASSGGRDAK